MKRSLGVRGLVVSTVMSMLLAPVLITAAHAASTIPCSTSATASLLYLVGSGETNGSELETYGTVLATQYYNTSGHQTLDPRKVDYPAIEVITPMTKIKDKMKAAQDATGDWGKFVAQVDLLNTMKLQLEGLAASVDQGAANAVAAIQDTITQCPNQKLVVAGYSQGAMALHEALTRLVPEELRHIAGAVFLGDPWFNDQGIKGLAASIKPLIDAVGVDSGLPGLAPPTPYVPDVLKDQYISWCEGQDPVCNVTSQVDAAVQQGITDLNTAKFKAMLLAVVSNPLLGLQSLDADLHSLVADLQTRIQAAKDWVSWASDCSNTNSLTCQHFWYNNDHFVNGGTTLRAWDVDVAIRMLNSLPVPMLVPVPNPGLTQPTSPDGTGCTTPDGGPGILQAGACIPAVGTIGFPPVA